MLQIYKVNIRIVLISRRETLSVIRVLRYLCVLYFVTQGRGLAAYTDFLVSV